LYGHVYAKRKGIQLDLDTAIKCVVDEKNIVDLIKDWERLNPESNTIIEL